MKTNVPENAALVVLGPTGLGFASMLKGILPGAQLHGLAGRVEGMDVSFTDTMAHLRQLFESGTPIVGLCASGILMRALGPALKDKHIEPPVVACSVDGSFAVPLLGGHHGANRLADAIAFSTGGKAAITTGGDLRYGIAFDDPPAGWSVSNVDEAKTVARELLAERPVALHVDAGSAAWLTESEAPFVDQSETCVRVTDKKAIEGELTLHPPVLVVGVGCERDCDSSELIGLVEKTLDDAGLSKGAVACVASIDLKADETAVQDLARHLGVTARFMPASDLEAQSVPNPSDVVFAEVGCHGVSEGSALFAVGGGELIVQKQKSKRATCAIGRADDLIDPTTIGQARGRLFVVGIGPGQADWRTPEATHSLMDSTDIVGYRLYLDLIDDLIKDKQHHMSELAQEEARARMALDIAAEGKTVSLVCSGDAGIYALATLVAELVDREDKPEWNRLEVVNVPGVSAFQAGAARLGAPFGHDFCLISLSDLLTPWDSIETRLEAAAAGDFVVAFYNPVSKRRRTQLARAKEILLTKRPGDTVVALCRNLGRVEEAITITSLDKLEVDDVDMLTLVIVGSTNSKAVKRGQRHWMYTPRGYAAKMKPLQTTLDQGDAS